MPGVKGEPLDKRLVLAVLYHLLVAVEHMVAAYSLPNNATSSQQQAYQQALWVLGRARSSFERLMSTSHYTPEDLF